MVIEAVVFDLDGVLVDSEPVWEEVRRRVVAEYGGHWDADTQDRLMGMSTGEWSRYLSSGLGVRLPPADVASVVIEAMAARYREHLPLMPGAVDAVRRMAGRFVLGLASSSPRSLIDTVLDAASLRSYFQAAMSTEEVALGKPAPDIYLAVAGAGQAARRVRGRRGLVERPALGGRGGPGGDRRSAPEVPAGARRDRGGPAGPAQP